MRRRCAGMLTTALAPTTGPAVSLTVSEKANDPSPPMAAPGPRVGLDIELRYAAVENGSAVCSGRPGRLSTVSPGPQPIQFCALVQDLLAPKASAWYPIGWPFRPPDFVYKGR
jgi:hypothetical protein